MTAARPLPAPGIAEVRIVAASPEAARQIAETLRRQFSCTEQRSSPAGTDGTGTVLHFSVDTVRDPDPATPVRPWLVTSQDGDPPPAGP